MKILILAIGKVRGPEAEWCEEYLKRFKSEVTVKEMTVAKTLSDSETQKAEAELLLSAIPAKSYVVVLDERGKDFSSRELAAKIQTWHEQSPNQLVFIIGGADGVTDKVRERSNFLLSFGRTTWPHRLVRVMLLEQLYRAQQINNGHPYHRD